MIRTYSDVSKRARNSINCQINKLVDKYGIKETRLVVMKYFSNYAAEIKCLKDIEEKEEELAELKKNKR